MSKTSEIRLKVQLDGQQLPERITWDTGNAGETEKECKSFMLSLWDAEERNTLRIDLWTKDMRVDDMSRHFFQTLLTMADTFERATKTQVRDDMRQFCENLSAKVAEQIKNLNTV